MRWFLKLVVVETTRSGLEGPSLWRQVEMVFEVVVMVTRLRWSGKVGRGGDWSRSWKLVVVEVG